MQLRLGREQDLPQLEKIIEAAVEQLHDAGIDQWQQGYPNITLIEQDIKLHQNYVLEEAGVIYGMFMLMREEEPDYRIIDGAWLNGEPYVCMHRVCVAKTEKGRGIAGIMFEEGARMAGSLGFSNMKIDTHPENLRMRRALEKAGYQYCGVIHLVGGEEAGAERVAYQRVLSDC